jgi:hypothetical protein
MDYQYIAPNLVQVSLKSESGDVIVYTMTTEMLIRSVNMAVALMNEHPARVLRDLEAF